MVHNKALRFPFSILLLASGLMLLTMPPAKSENVGMSVENASRTSDALQFRHFQGNTDSPPRPSIKSLSDITRSLNETADTASTGSKLNQLFDFSQLQAKNDPVKVPPSVSSGVSPREAISPRAIESRLLSDGRFKRVPFFPRNGNPSTRGSNWAMDFFWPVLIYFLDSSGNPIYFFSNDFRYGRSFWFPSFFFRRTAPLQVITISPSLSSEMPSVIYLTGLMMLLSGGYPSHRKRIIGYGLLILLLGSAAVYFSFPVFRF